MIRHQASSAMYCLEVTFRNGSVCRLMEINVTVHEKEPICTTIYTPVSNNLQLSCEWNPLDLEDGAQIMIRNRLFTGNIMTTTSDKNLTSMISTAVSMDDVLSENNIPDRCVVSRNEINATCNFPIYMKSKEEKTKESDSLIFECCSTRANEPQISVYDISGNPWPSRSSGIFVIHEKPPSKCDKKSPSILICANETYNEIIEYGLAKLFLSTQSQILTSISHVSEHEMVETGHCENGFNIDVRSYPPRLSDKTTASTVGKINASDIRNSHHIQCQEEHSIAPTLTTQNLTSISRTVYPKECLEQRNVTREVYKGDCLSVTVHSYRSLTERRKISIRKPVGSGILISCYMFHGTCFNSSNRRLGAIIYDNGTIKVSLSQANVEDSGEYVFEIREDNTILCEIGRVNITVLDVLEREPTCSTRIKKYSRNLQFNCEWLQNDTYTGRARLMIGNRTIYHYRTRWKRNNRNHCFTKKRQIIADVNFEFLFSGMPFQYSCGVSYGETILRTCTFSLYMYMDPATMILSNHDINIISLNCFTEGENIPNIWYYDTDEYSLINITGQLVQIPNRMDKWRSVYDNNILLLCGKENEDDYEFFGMGKIVFDSSLYSNISLSAEWIGFNRSTRNSTHPHQYNITLIWKSVFAESEIGFRNSSQSYGYQGNITNLPEVDLLLDAKSSQIILILVLILTGMSFLFSIWKCLKRFCLHLKCKNRQREVELRNFHINESVDVNQNTVETLNMGVVSSHSLQPPNTEIEPNLPDHPEDRIDVSETNSCVHPADDEFSLLPEQAGLSSSPQIYQSPINGNQDILPQEWSDQGASSWSNPSVTAGHWLHESLQDDQRELPGEVDSVVRTFSTLYYCLENTGTRKFYGRRESTKWFTGLCGKNKPNRDDRKLS